MITLFTGIANKITPVKPEQERALTTDEVKAANRVNGAFDPRIYRQHRSVKRQLDQLHAQPEIDNYDNKAIFAIDALNVLRMRKKSEEIQTTVGLLNDPLASARLRHVGENAIRIRAVILVPILAAISFSTFPEDAPNPQETNQSSIQGSLQSSMSDN